MEDMAHLPDMMSVSGSLPVDPGSYYGGSRNLNPAQFSDGLENQGNQANLNPANGAPAEGPNDYSGMAVDEY